jgi:hypothetical protein
MPAESRFDRQLHAWKEAEQRAREAELLLYCGYSDFVTGKGPQPPEHLEREAASLRAHARVCYREAMAAVDRVLADADRRALDL